MPRDPEAVVAKSLLGLRKLVVCRCHAARLQGITSQNMDLFMAFPGDVNELPWKIETLEVYS
jgi:hypothetical protein